MKKLIINADDFGSSAVFNGKIIELLEKGLIKSTTVMVNRFTEAMNPQIKQISEIKGISIGLHLELDPAKALRKQMDQQFKKFLGVFSFPPSHFDMHVPKMDSEKMSNPNIIAELNKFAERQQLPVRNHGSETKAKHTTYPAFHNASFTLELSEIEDFLSKLNEGESVELITHPGDYDPESKSSLNKERKDDFDKIILLQPILQKFEISNISYFEL